MRLEDNNSVTLLYEMCALAIVSVNENCAGHLMVDRLGTMLYV